MEHSQIKTAIEILTLILFLCAVAGLFMYLSKERKRNANLKPTDVKPSEVPALKDFPFTRHYYSREHMAPFRKLFTREKDSLGTMDICDPIGTLIGHVFVGSKFHFTVESKAVVVECEYNQKQTEENPNDIKFFTAHDKQTVMTVASMYDRASGPFEFTIKDRKFKLNSISVTKKIFDVEENGQVIGRICATTWSQYVLAVFSKEMDDLAVCFIFGVYGRMGR